MSGLPILAPLVGCGGPSSAPPLLVAGGGSVLAVDYQGGLHARADTDVVSAWTPVALPAKVVRGATVDGGGAWWVVGDDHVLTSADRGRTWTRLPDPPPLLPQTGWPRAPWWREVAVAADGTVVVGGSGGLVTYRGGRWSPLLPERIATVLVRGNDLLVAGTDWDLWCGTLPGPPTDCGSGLPRHPSASTATRIALRGDGTWLAGAHRGVFAGPPWVQVATQPGSDALLEIPFLVAPALAPDELVVLWNATAEVQGPAGIRPLALQPIHATVAGGYLWTAGPGGAAYSIAATDAAGVSVIVPSP